MATPLQQTIRRYVMTGGVAAITITGALYGAGLKNDYDVKQARRQAETNPQEIIAQLEEARSLLVIKRTEMERKIANAVADRKKREEEEQAAQK